VLTLVIALQVAKLMKVHFVNNSVTHIEEKGFGGVDVKN
jgi:hypothetical protein